LFPLSLVAFKNLSSSQKMKASLKRAVQKQRKILKLMKLKVK